MTVQTGRLTVAGSKHGRAPGAHIMLDGDYIGDVGYNREDADRDAFAADLALRYNTFPVLLEALVEAQAALARIPDSAKYTTSGMHERIAEAIHAAEYEAQKAGAL